MANLKYNLVGFSARMGGGKDLGGQIVNYLASAEYDGGMSFEEWEALDTWVNHYEVKKYAYKLKQIVALLIGCTVEDLEDRDFKEKELGEEWWYYEVLGQKGSYPEHKPLGDSEKYLVKPTPRLLLQLLGTEGMRDVIHPNVHVNALFSDYKPIDNRSIQDPAAEGTYPNWAVTDVRFPNEVKAIQDRGGIVIRLLRKVRKTSAQWIEKYTDYVILDPDGWDRANFEYSWGEEEITEEEFISRRLKSTCAIFSPSNPVVEEHFSETALDNFEGFDHIIDNNGSKEDLVNAIKAILI